MHPFQSLFQSCQVENILSMITDLSQYVVMLGEFEHDPVSSSDPIRYSLFGTPCLRHQWAT